MICIVVARSHGYCSDSDDLKPFLQMVVHAVLKGTADCPQPIVASENGLTVESSVTLSGIRPRRFHRIL